MRAAVGLLALLLLLPAGAFARDPSALDPAYGRGGLAVAGVSGSAAVSPDGRAVFAGDGGVVERLTRSGGRDRRFGRGGRTPALVPGLRVTAVASATDGSVAVAGRRGDATVILRVRDDGRAVDFAELRGEPAATALSIRPDGTVFAVLGVDTIARLSGRRRIEAEWSRPGIGRIRRIAPTGSGLFVAAERTRGAGGDAIVDAVLVRLDERGAVDVTFGGAGGVEQQFAFVTALLAHEGEPLLSTAWCSDDSELCDGFGFRRFDPAGAETGRVGASDEFGETAALAATRAGDVVAAGPVDDRLGRSSAFYVRRWLGGSDLDARFGRCGGVPVPVPRRRIVRGLAVQANGRIVGVLTPRGGGRALAVALRGGSGAPRLLRPVLAARSAAAGSEYFSGRFATLRVDSDVPARVHVRAVVTGIRHVHGSTRPLAARGRARHRLPRVAGRASARVRGCRPEQQLSVPLDRRVARWSRAHPSSFVVVRLEATARNGAGVASATGTDEL